MDHRLVQHIEKALGWAVTSSGSRLRELRDAQGLTLTQLDPKPRSTG